MLPSLVPNVGMEFRNLDEARTFWLSYGGQKGFEAESGTQTKENLMGKSHHVSLFVQMRVID